MVPSPEVQEPPKVEISENDEKNGSEGVKNLDGKTAAKEANAIMNDEKTLNDLDQLRILKNSYDMDKLEGAQRDDYENVMNKIKVELDKTIPSVISMNQEIDTEIGKDMNEYYKNHPEEAAAEADKIVNDYESMKPVNLVGKVISRSEYLGAESKQKLYTVIKQFESDIKTLIEK